MSSDYISKSAVIELIESKMTDGCLGTEDDTFIGGHGLVDEISDLPTLDEKEIIRKPFERIVEELKKAREKQTSEKWVECPYADLIMCPSCNAEFSTIDNCTEQFEYCPKCGKRLE